MPNVLLSCVTEMGNLCGGQTTPTKEETKKKIEEEWKVHSELYAKFIRIEAGSREEGNDAFGRGVSMDNALRHFDKADAAATLLGLEATYLDEILTRLVIDPNMVNAGEFHRQYTEMVARGDELFGSSEAKEAFDLIVLLQ